MVIAQISDTHILARPSDGPDRLLVFPAFGLKYRQYTGYSRATRTLQSLFSMDGSSQQVPVSWPIHRLS